MRYLLVFLFSMLGSARCGAADLTTDEVLALMKANDAQFDNVLVKYDYTRHEQVKRRPKPVPVTIQVDPRIDASTIPPESELMELFARYVFHDANNPPGPVPEDKKKWLRMLEEGKLTFKSVGPPQPESRIEIRKTTSRQTMGLRWPDLAMLRQRTPRSWSKCSAIGERTYLLYPVISGPKREWFLSKSEVSYFPNPYQRGAIWRRFALGIGYSQLISKVTSFERTGDGYRMNVEIDWWSHTTGQGTLELDESLVVRTAEITYGPVKVVASTEDHYHDDERRFVCAREGQFEETRGARQVRKFDMTLHSVRFDMTDAQFDELSDMSSPLDEARYEYDDNGPVRQVRRAGPIQITDWSGRDRPDLPRSVREP